jgi:CRISPR/Cas system type I-B associated protein Csh2 (Cas7 group RAMP superfamily)
MLIYDKVNDSTADGWEENSIRYKKTLKKKTSDVRMKEKIKERLFKYEG